MGTRSQHVVAIPYPAQGHINPMLQLCQQLVPHGFTFTFVNTHHIHQRMQSAVANELDGHTAHQTNQGADVNHSHHTNGYAHTINIAHHGADSTVNEHHGVEEAQGNVNAPHDGQIRPTQSPHSKEWDRIRMVFVEGGCAPEKHAYASTTSEPFRAAQGMREQVEQLLSNMVEEQGVAFILTDILLGWGSATASKFGLSWVCFWPASAATYAAAIYFADLAEQGKQMAITEGENTVIDEIPGLPATRLHDLPQIWDGRGKWFLKLFTQAEHACFLLLNTFAELEGQALQALSKRYSTLAVGPLIPSPYMSRGGAHTRPDRKDDGVLCRPSLYREDRTCLDWLDTQAPASVLFISFGSISARTDEQLEELGHAVDASGCPFLWVRKPDTAAGRQQYRNGLIVPWAPQLDVLAHPAVGGFLTHCGWNSLVESVAMGVPMLCWADTGERLCNQRFAVQFWKCGLDMVSDSRRHRQSFDEAVLVRRDEIEKSIRRLMLEEVGAPIRARAVDLRHSAILACHNSHSNLSSFVQAMQLQNVSQIRTGFAQCKL